VTFQFKLLLAPMELLTYSKNPSSDPLQKLWSGIYDHENTYRNPHVALKNHTGSRQGHVREFTRIFFCITWGVDTGEYQPMTEWEAGTEVMRRLPDPSLKLVRLLTEARKIFRFTFSTTRHSKNWKTSGAWT
jgi:hypothetical protein